MSWRQQTTAKKLRRPRALTKNGAPRAKPVDWEGQEQAVLIRWLYGEKMRGHPVGELFDATFHMPNGGHCNKKTASDFKRQGVKAGVSDLPIRQARGGWLGLYLEFKATPPKDAPLADSQFKWLEDSEYEGYCAVLALGFEEAKAVLREYASWPRTQIASERLALESGAEWRNG
ncbi:VRR-NUC domain-containing protein [Vreelandella titanicae]|uniref:VRR-NUC domain-containing protein n=1 Tax=Vreelandella titanicae TaxID=664683 RepID=UPI00114383E4|nr:VRR-NUC domain-containing protein [Halomonas titanicae]